jgi:hypothetical protein
MGTVVGPVDDEKDKRRWRRAVTGSEQKWMVTHTWRGDSVLEAFWYSWHELLEIGVREYPDPADPDGRQSELDALRQENARLDQALRDAAENLTQAEKDRDDGWATAESWRRVAAEHNRRRSDLNLRMREVSNWNARIVHILLGSFDEKGDREAQAAAAIGRAEALVEATGSAVES